MDGLCLCVYVLSVCMSRNMDENGVSIWTEFPKATELLQKTPLLYDGVNQDKSCA